MAERQFITVPLSSLFRDPDVRAAFWRAEREDGNECPVIVERRPVLSGGEMAE